MTWELFYKYFNRSNTTFAKSFYRKPLTLFQFLSFSSIKLTPRQQKRKEKTKEKLIDISIPDSGIAEIGESGRRIPFWTNSSRLARTEIFLSSAIKKWKKREQKHATEKWHKLESNKNKITKNCAEEIEKESAERKKTKKN